MKLQNMVIDTNRYENLLFKTELQNIQKKCDRNQCKYKLIVNNANRGSSMSICAKTFNFWNRSRKS